MQSNEIHTALNVIVVSEFKNANKTKKSLQTRNNDAKKNRKKRNFSKHKPQKFRVET